MGVPKRVVACGRYTNVNSGIFMARSQYGPIGCLFEWKKIWAGRMNLWALRILRYCTKLMELVRPWKASQTKCTTLGTSAGDTSMVPELNFRTWSVRIALVLLLGSWSSFKPEADDEVVILSAFNEFTPLYKKQRLESIRMDVVKIALQMRGFWNSRNTEIGNVFVL